jgi:hypothetical protein
MMPVGNDVIKLSGEGRICGHWFAIGRDFFAVYGTILPDMQLLLMWPNPVFRNCRTLP